MKRKIGNERGQALLMVTFSLITICGVMGLAVDLGWAYFVEKTARAATDAGALAAARKAFGTLGQKGPYTCGTGLECQAEPLDCATLANGGNLASGCRYASQNFNTGGSRNRQRLVIQAGTSSPYMTATGPVEVKYWVRVTAAESIPQLFSAVMGNTMATASARATAAVVNQVVDGALVLLNRRKDRAVFNNTDYYGTNLLVQANDNQGRYALQTSGNIILSSTCNGTSLGAGDCRAGNRPAYAGINQGGGTIYSPGTAIAGSGGYDLQGSSQWTRTPINGVAAGDDPMSSKGQPPVPLIGNDVKVPGGIIDGTVCPGGVCLPGKYYATAQQNCGAGCTLEVASGAPLQVSGDVRFAACNGCDPALSFGSYIFFGGLRASGSGANVIFDPGTYVFAGAKPANNLPGVLLDTSTNMNLRDNTVSTDRNTDAGELFIFTGADSSGLFNYPGLQAQVPALVAANGGAFQMGTVLVMSGNNGTVVNLHGLNKDHSAIQGTPLENFAPTLMWQDQANSFVKYDSNGKVDFKSCGGGHTLDDPCANTLANIHSPEIQIQASPSIHLYGTIYQPRGAWLTLVGGGGYAGPLQLISGAVNVQGNANIDLLGVAKPLMITAVALIE